MKIADKISSRARFVQVVLTIITVLLAMLSYFAAVMSVYGNAYEGLTYLYSTDFMVTSIFIALFWVAMEYALGLNDVYRSRSYSVVVLFIFMENVIGAVLLSFASIVVGFANYGQMVMLLFGLYSTFTICVFKVLFYRLLRYLRKRGYNQKNVVFVCDKAGEKLLRAIIGHVDWGYKVVGIIGDEYMVNKYKYRYVTYDINKCNPERVIIPEVQEVIYAREYDSSKEITKYIDLCADLGCTFRLYSPFLNRISRNTQVRYFDTTAVVTVSNTPDNYLALVIKRIVDVIFSSCVLIIGLPFYILIALIIKLDSRGPVFFKQERSGLRKKTFMLYKFRTMVANAEELKESLREQNEMTGPVFKMERDPRITRVGRFLRKTGIDEIPQFINVFRGDMSVVGPRPPLPKEVEQYERWQLRRLAMKPGITCIWQVSKNRNSITFDEWMRLDMEYIDNWSLSLDAIIMLKTVRTVLRADGK